MASYNVNYDDERFTQLEQEKQSELNKYNQTYDALIDERNQFTNQQQDLVNQWQQTQEQIANDNLNHQINLYNQQKEQAEKDYQNEAKASYIDYQKETDRYGVSREQMAQNGLSNSGYSESSKVNMYNTYQNRIASARQSKETAMLEFNNAIEQARLTNNATLAENALTALKQKLDIALEGFNYKDTATQNKLNWEYNINNNYYDRYKDVESQLNYENEQAEAIRQYQEQMAYQREQDALAQQRWEQEMAYQKQQDAITNAQNWDQINAQKKYYEELTGKEDENDNDERLPEDYYFSNGYQPKYLNTGNGYTQLQKSGLKINDVFSDAPVSGTQNVWQIGSNYYVWIGNGNKGGQYVDVTSQVNDSKKRKVCVPW